VQADHVAILLFLLLYNVLRGILLWKTKSLEVEQASTGRVPRFFLEGGWSILFTLFQYGFWINLALIGYHTYHFMQLKVPHP
jgi:hypothetical protein